MIANVLFSLLSIFTMIFVIVFHYLRELPIPWLYITLGSLLYFAGIFSICMGRATGGLSSKEFKRLFLGCHLSYLLISGGTFLVLATGFWGSLGILITSIALGLTPSLIATLEDVD